MGIWRGLFKRGCQVRENVFKYSCPMEEQNLVREAIVETQGPKLVTLPLLVGAVLIIFLGAVTGYFLSAKSLPGLGIQKVTQETVAGSIKKGTVFGSDDLKTFRDTTEGVLEKGGINGEGSHRLIRPGGESQTVYLTSSIVDLDQFVSRKIKVWGETNKAQKAGWLMDIGRVEVLE